MIFYLTTHEQAWLWNEHVDFPLFVSRRRLARVKKLCPAGSGRCLAFRIALSLHARASSMSRPAAHCVLSELIDLSL